MRKSLIVILTLWCCQMVMAAPSYTDTKKPQLVRASHNTVRITMQSNPTTGYFWYLGKYNTNLITPVSYKFYPPSTKLVGAPGYAEWIFKLKPAAFSVPHFLQIKFVHLRPWDLMSEAVSSYAIITKR